MVHTGVAVPWASAALVDGVFQVGTVAALPALLLLLTVCLIFPPPFFLLFTILFEGLASSESLVEFAVRFLSEHTKECRETLLEAS